MLRFTLTMPDLIVPKWFLCGWITMPCAEDLILLICQISPSDFWLFGYAKREKSNGPDLANNEDDVLGVGDCDPKTEQPFWHNEIWHCQRESQNVTLDHLDKEQEFG
jgi:hypothetical protein